MDKPDFKQWIKDLFSLPPHSNHPSSIEQALRDAFNQGVAFGRRSNDKTNEYEGVF